MREIKNVIITGPTGAIGMALIQELLSRDINVTCVVNPDSKRIDRIKENDRVAMIKCDLKDIKSLSKVLDKERREGHSFPDRYDVFYHFAWMNTFGQGRDDIPSQMENVRYTMDAMDAAKDLGVRLFIGAGSQAEYGRSNEALRADTPAFPENGYGVAKLAAGQFGKIRAKQLGMEFIWTRILSVYGPYDGGGTLVQSMISKLKIGEVPETTKGEQIWDYLYSKDAARAFYLIARKGKNEKTYVILLGFSPEGAASIGIIGGADGPTAIYLTSKLEPQLLGAIAIAAYSYMALIPMIQPPIMKALTTKKARQVKMELSRPVSKVEKICFPIIVTVVCVLILPSVAPLLGCLMLGNLFRESGVTERLSETSQNAMCNIVTIFLGTSVGATAVGKNFLQLQTIMIIVIGLVAFALATVGGLLIGDLMYVLSGGKINPLIGSAGVSAVPMAARVSSKVGQKENPSNFLLMHAMGPNVAGVIGSAIAAGVLLTLFG